MTPFLKEILKKNQKGRNNKINSSSRDLCVRAACTFQSARLRRKWNCLLVPFFFFFFFKWISCCFKPEPSAGIEDLQTTQAGLHFLTYCVYYYWFIIIIWMSFFPAVWVKRGLWKDLFRLSWLVLLLCHWKKLGDIERQWLTLKWRRALLHPSPCSPWSPQDLTVNKTLRLRGEGHFLA